MDRSLKKSIQYAKISLIKNSEAVIWILGLSYLAFINPYNSNHISICPLHLVGFDYCPGCGLGKSVSFIFHGDIYHSLNSHPLGIVALILLSFRIVTLIRKNYKASKTPPEVYYG